MYLSGITCHGYCNTPGAEPTTSIPAVEDAANVGHGLGQPGVAHRAVHDAVGFGRDDRVEVIGRGDAGRHAQPGQFACVLAHLGVRRHPDAGQVEARVVHQLLQREAAAVAGADERDADRMRP